MSIQNASRGTENNLLLNVLPNLFQVGGILHYASLSAMFSLAFMARNISKDVCNDPLKTPDKSEVTQSTPTIFR